MTHITLREVQEEVGAMLTTCFEGELTCIHGELVFTFPNGQQFCIRVERAEKRTLSQAQKRA